MTAHKYIDRIASKNILDMCKWYPVVSVTGPRQSGKSTLLKHLFPDYEYINLEDARNRQLALRDPVAFIDNRLGKTIIDEAQYAPEIFSQIQARVDESNDKGEFIISGSQNFLLLKNIKQSLAGRVGMVKLLPLSYAEIKRADLLESTNKMMFYGGYPGLLSEEIPHNIFFDNYVNTYAIRDITELISPSNVSSFKNFLQICALHASNLINFTNIAQKADITRQTCKSWISYLETSYITFELQPYFTNKIKTLTKTSKLYFYDTGLLVYLLGIRTPEELAESEHLGMIFENYVISETIKMYYNKLISPQLYFYRDDSKVEADLLDLTTNGAHTLTEIKASHTFHQNFTTQLKTIEGKLPISIDKLQVIMQTIESFKYKDIHINSIDDYFEQ